MKDSFTTILISAIAILAYFYQSQLYALESLKKSVETLDGLYQRSGNFKNESLTGNLSDNHTKDEGISHPKLKHKERRFYHEDFPKYFNVRVTHELKTDESIKDLIDAKDIFQGEVYLKSKAYYDTMIEIFGPFIEDFPQDDRRFYVAFCSPEKGYGAFAAVDIPKNAYIGEYTGIVTNKTSNTDYAWSVIEVHLQ